MPVFNHRNDVATMIDCIRVNNFADWELLIVDDGSDVETLDMLAEYVKIDQRIRIIRRERTPKGAPTCRNLGFDAAIGEYVVFFDSDDYITSACLGQRVDAMESHSDMDFMVFPSGIYSDAEGFKVSPHINAYGYKVFDDDVKAFSRRKLPFIVWNNIYRAESIRNHHLTWDEHLLSLQDCDYNIKAITGGMKYCYATDAETDYGYRISSVASISKKANTTAHFLSHARAVDNIYRCVRGCFGNKYDLALYEGVLFLYNAVASGRGTMDDFADILLPVVRKYTPFYAKLLSFQISTSNVLRRFLPDKLSRQIPMLLFLVARTFWTKHKVKIIQSELAVRKIKTNRNL